MRVVETFRFTCHEPGPSGDEQVALIASHVVTFFWYYLNYSLLFRLRTKVKRRAACIAG